MVTESAVQIPPGRLSPAALERLIEEFVTRDGTDYGERELSLEQKRTTVKRQLDRGEVIIMFDPATESTTIVPKELVE